MNLTACLLVSCASQGYNHPRLSPCGSPIRTHALQPSVAGVAIQNEVLARINIELDRVTYDNIDIIVCRPQNAVNPLNQPGQRPYDTSL